MDTKDAGRMGGASKSPAKQQASRANGRKGGRPRQTRPFCSTISKEYKRKLREDASRLGCHYGIFFDTSGKVHTEQINPTAQYAYLWRTDT